MQELTDAQALKALIDWQAELGADLPLGDVPVDRYAAVVPARGARPALDYARSWGYDAAVVCDARGAEVHRLSDGARKRLPRALASLGTWAR